MQAFWADGQLISPLVPARIAFSADTRSGEAARTRGPLPPLLEWQTPGVGLAPVVAGVTAEVEEFAASGLPDDLCVVAARIDES